MVWNSIAPSRMANASGVSLLLFVSLNKALFSIKINCSNIPDGPYIISLQERGKTIATKIIIIQN